MAHSFVQAFDDELGAFAAFAEIYPSTVLLVDTYDTLEGVRRAIELAHRLGDDCQLTGVRLDSGDLEALSRAARGMLDEAGLGRLKIVASGGLNERRAEALVKAGAPIDVFGVGTEMSVSSDAPALDIAYKLPEYAGRGRMKLSARKGTLPGRKQVFRRTADGGPLICASANLAAPRRDNEITISSTPEPARRRRAAEFGAEECIMRKRNIPS